MFAKFSGVKSLGTSMLHLDIMPCYSQLDQRDDGDAIQAALAEITGGRSVPRVFIGGKFIGGGDDTVSGGHVWGGICLPWGTVRWCCGHRETPFLPVVPCTRRAPE
jgi:hypothetical protein